MALLAFVVVVGIVCFAGYALAFRWGDAELTLIPPR
jgi:hypothetical protein